jgi:ABC-2 type transport system permease protein
MTPFFRQIRILARVQRQMLTARLGDSFRKSKLMAVTLTGFMIGYLVIGYLLFSHGLNFVTQLPGVGYLMVERVFYLMIFFFFVMLVFSNAIISYSSLFRSKETQWLLTLPIDHRALFSWKVVETLLVSSWGLIFLSAPLLAAYGQIFGVEWHFYIKSFVLYLPFVAIPSAVSSWLLILTVRYANRYWKYAIIAAFVFMASKFGASLYTDHVEAMASSESIALTFNQVLRHTEMSVNPLMPSTWMSEVILQWAKGYETQVAILYPLLLFSYALMGGWITVALVSRAYYGAWNQSSLRRAQSSWRRRKKIMGRKSATGFHCPPLWLRILAPRRAMQALISKDIKCFTRDPSQWVQCVIVFGLLFMYVFNMRNMGRNFTTSFWTTIISYLNFGVIALALSTLTTRFVFPQFSLEGGRLWILGLAPFNLDKVVRQKFFLSLAVIGTLTVPLMALSGYMLNLPGHRIAFFVFAIGMMSVGLCGLSVGLGTLFPDFNEQNPAKIVSGFGGTLCLILNFIFIILFITCLLMPAMAPFIAEKTGSQSHFLVKNAEAVTIGMIVNLTAIAGSVPMFLGIQRVKRLELLGNL